jgi:hypothetical protein
MDDPSSLPRPVHAESVENDIPFRQSFTLMRGGTTGPNRNTFSATAACGKGHADRRHLCPLPFSLKYFPPPARIGVLGGFLKRLFLRHEKRKQTKRGCARHTAE